MQRHLFPEMTLAAMRYPNLIVVED